MRATVVILTKLPGRLPVKTRLVPRLGERGAIEFYLEMLRATVELAREFTPRPILACSPPDADPAAALPGIAGCDLRPVQGSDGAECLENALLHADCGLPLLALGGDAPDLPRSRLEQAVALLRKRDAVLVPTGDGGFSCLGLKRPVAGLAGGFRYGGCDALDSLRAFFAARGLTVGLLDPWPDIDTPADYEAYRARQA